MQLLNVLSVPRADALFVRKILTANCLATDVVGNCVCITGPDVVGKYQVMTADPADVNKMPAWGVIKKKVSPTECKVQFVGEIKGMYGSMIPQDVLFVASDGKLSNVPPTPLVGGYAFVQAMGHVLSTSALLLMPTFSLTKRIG